jgi:hypothetical protein
MAQGRATALPGGFLLAAAWALWRAPITCHIDTVSRAGDRWSGQPAPAPSPRRQTP